MADPKIIIDGEQKPEEPQDEIVVVTGDEPSTPDPKTDGGAGDDDGDEDDNQDLRVSHEQREDEQATRRNERQQRKERQRLARERKDLEIETLRQQNEQMRRDIDRLNQGQQTQVVADLDQRIGFAKQHVQAAEAQVVDATNRGDGAALVQAMKYRDDANQAVNQLERDKAARTARTPQPQQQQRPAVDPAVARLAAQWTEANPWFDFNADTPEVRKAKAAERELLSEGYKPSDRTFWTELTKRVSNVDAPRKNGGPKVGGGNETAGKRSVEYRISADRVQAMKDGGIWEDPVRREKQIRAFMQYDKDHPTTAR
jgi:hypothetical protein